MSRLPFRMSETRILPTPMSLASRYGVIPIGSQKSNRSISPG
jgi:hypothetical protein